MKPISLLLVDDSPMFLRTLTRFLQWNLPGEVVIVGTAGGGEEALTKAEELRPDVILLDLAMPGLSGLEAIPRLRRLMPDVGIIVLTLLDGNGYREAALSACADDFIPKATLETDLVPAIRRAIRASRSRQEEHPRVKVRPGGCGRGAWMISGPNPDPPDRDEQGI